MEVLSIKQFQCFNSSNKLDRLNNLVYLHNSLMPHQVAAATGCDLDDAMGLLLYLSSLSLVKPKLLVYHTNDLIDPPNYILSRDIELGFPELPFVCSECGETIESYEYLRFEFAFILKEKVVFGF
jgi:hypothetical protein